MCTECVKFTIKPLEQRQQNKFEQTQYNIQLTNLFLLVTLNKYSPGQYYTTSHETTIWPRQNNNDCKNWKCLCMGHKFQRLKSIKNEKNIIEKCKPQPNEEGFEVYN